MTSAPPALKRPLSDMPCDPGYIQLSYELEASLDNSDREDTLEKWRVTAHLGEDGFRLEAIPPCDQCTARWNRTEDEGGFVDEDEDCPHRLHVGVLELVKVRWGGSQNPFWAMEEESQNLYEIAETVFNDEHDGYTEEFEELTEAWGEDLLVLDKAELDEGWRGFGLGPMIAADALRRLAPGCRAVMVHPAPIDATGMSKDEWARARDRLRELWATVGFVPYGETPYMIFATCWADPENKQYALRKASRELSTQWRAARQRG
ncbi:hypothetical protein CIB93_04470 [Streptomyces sp. WZ.A104]|uniref:hypothetical protein n=1 Tax=Streptomyces sp. WZ.A104 TaxID=2023771 RepID=UPI000BBC1A4F|nr:hypothetical protein [Streptomyces sp. WZ.A104]PCG87107.1 hypothetical protein CIB93_04470 [Streptomyces sp. WZ.A104]